MANIPCRKCKHEEKAHTSFACLGCLQFAYSSFQVCNGFTPDNLGYLEKKLDEKELKEYIDEAGL